ncbi:MAG: Abi family protein [Ruminococcus sp.]|nr:Abi family protein [Ruminococcus sp.]
MIGGYKHPFRDKMTRVYIKNTTFEDVYALYQFDDQLRELFLKYLCQIEMKVRSLLSYAFCEQHGELQSSYLNVLNYNCSRKNQQGIHRFKEKSAAAFHM